jgi:mono/diheme cytochrome c family protein
VDLAARGEKVYRSACIACHAPDPTQPGPVGPEIAGSSLELLRAKVLRNEYPPGYAPRRETRAMVPLPHLEPDLPALAAYLARAAEG